jgi:serine/threonine protein kinase
MATFEPVSREHAGFVDILHVGRSDDDAFFYYVMELADDVVARESFDPDIYQPKTLKSELQRVSRLPADEVVALGMSLTLALSALHRHGLVHRDIKPANIIFVGGHPKIADIGLVSPLGQESFVGTEGYVPPEGPGTAQADLFSLGKVLYEIAMGKDRLDSPRWPTISKISPIATCCSSSIKCCGARAHTIPANATRPPMKCTRTCESAGRTPAQWRRSSQAPLLPIAALLLATASGLAWWKVGRQRTGGVGKFMIETDPPGLEASIRFESKDGHGLVKKTSEPMNLPAGRHKVTHLGRCEVRCRESRVRSRGRPTPANPNGQTDPLQEHCAYRINASQSRFRAARWRASDAFR